MATQDYRHEIEGIGLLEQAIYEPLTLRGSSSSSRSSGMMSFCVANHKDYTIIAYPGPEIVMGGRAEHLPLHFHIKCKQNKQELRVKTADLQELEGKKIPRDLRKFLEKQDVREYLAINTENIYKTGKLLGEKKSF
jgi:hypothetical protein